MGRLHLFKKILITSALIMAMLMVLFLMAFFKENNLSAGSGVIVIVALLGVLMTPRTSQA
jgi:uncharacterized membrane protein YqjE